MNLSKAQRVSAISGAGTLLAGVGGAVATTDWRIGLYGLLVSVLAGVSGALWPSKPAQPFVTTLTGPAYLDPSVKASEAGQDVAARAKAYAAAAKKYGAPLFPDPTGIATPPFTPSGRISSVGPLSYFGLPHPAGSGADHYTTTKPDDEPPTAPTPVG